MPTIIPKSRSKKLTCKLTGTGAIIALVTLSTPSCDSNPLALFKRTTPNPATEYKTPDSNHSDKDIPWVLKMPAIPEPLVMRDWATVSEKYYTLVLNKDTELNGKKTIIEKKKPLQKAVDRVNFAIPSYMAQKPDQEIFTCLSAVIGAKLMDQDLTKQAGFDYVESSKNWFDSKNGVYRHRPTESQPNFHSGIYGYWGTVYGLALAHLYPEDTDFQNYAISTYETYLEIAKGLGAPNKPDFSNLGFDFNSMGPGGRNEPMNRLGNAPNVAWPLLLGYTKTKNPEMLECAVSIMKWYTQNPGRYEGTYLMGPLVAAKLNALYGESIDLDQTLAAWFGDGDRKMHPWHVTAKSSFGGIDCAGVDAAKRDMKKHTFHGFTMGTLNGPSWLAPVLRYDQRYAKSIARYLLNAANSSRLFQGYQLDWNHQDHKDWKDQWDPEYLLFYEALTPTEYSKERKFSPYATGDPISHGWGTEKVSRENYLDEKKNWFSKSENNISLYMGNHVGFLGSICSLTEVPGILRWDCLKTDWHHGKAFPTFLYHNPHTNDQTVTVPLENPCNIYDSVSGKFIAYSQNVTFNLTLKPDQAVVLVTTPITANITSKGSKLFANDVVIDYQLKK